MKSAWDLANPQLRDLITYEPGKPIEETARELGVDPVEVVKLASNENPLGPSPKAVKAMQAALEQAHRYPDGGGYYLRQALANHLGIDLGEIILGNGSNEVIEFICHGFLRPGEEVVTCRYAFIAYKIATTLFGAQTVEVEGSDFGQDLSAMLNAITSRTRLVFVPNPNNPTGSLVGQEEIDAYMARVPDNIITVFDEAYFELLQHPSDVLRYVRQGRNVVVLRTFSKIHGLAAVRVGYGIAPKPIIEVLQKAREPFNVNSIGQTGALAALSDSDHQDKTKRIVEEGRAYLENQFSAIGLRFLPAAANFIMVNVGDGTELFRKMLAQKVIVRPLRGYGLTDWVRISVGTMEENKKCIAALKTCFQSKDRA